MFSIRPFLTRYLVKTRKEKAGGVSVSYLVKEETGPKTVEMTPEGIVKLFRRVAAGCVHVLEESISFEKRHQLKNFPTG